MTSELSSTSSSSNLTSAFQQVLEKTGALTPSTWPIWADILPQYAGAAAKVPAPTLYLGGKIDRPDYKDNDVVILLTDPTKKDELARYQQWQNLAQALKMGVELYGGPDAAARVKSFDSSHGKAPQLWAEIKKWYGETDTGSEKVVLLSKLVQDRWDHTQEAPSVYFNRIKLLQTRINDAYKSEAEARTDQTDPHTIADLNASISNSLLRDLVLAFLPERYSDALNTSLKKTTTYNEVVTFVTSFHASKEAREEIATTIEARQITAREKSNSNSNSNWRRNRDQDRKKSNDDRPRINVTKYHGYDRWRGGTFSDAEGRIRFRIPKDTCFKCFKQGHQSRICRLRNDLKAAAKSRVQELKKNDISVPEEEANALLVISSNVDDLTSEDIEALIATSANNNGGRIVEENINPSVAFTSTDPPHDSDAPPFITIHVSAFAVTDLDSYVIDSGANRHITTVQDHLVDYAPFDKPIPIAGVFGSAGEALGEGTIFLKGDSSSIKLTKVLYAPKLGVNLVSMTRMMLGGIKFTGNERLLSLYDTQYRHLIDLPVTPTIRMQVRTNLRSLSDSSPSAFRTSTDELRIWHDRLGHISDSRLKLALGEWVGSVKISEECEECVRAKATRISASKVAENGATRKLERVSADTWGPSPVRGLKGERYGILLVDNWSRFAWVATVSSKGSIVDVIKERIRREEGSQDLKVFAFQSDNGTEFVNYEFEEFCKSQGIQHRRTIAYAHGQNGFVERRWRQLLETTRALLSTSKLPPTFWPYALKTAVYLYNRQPSSAIAGKSPFELYYGRESGLKHLRVWGSTAWLSLPREGTYRRNKLQSRAVKGRLIGYCEDQKGWLFWVPEWKKIVGWIEIARWEERKFGNEGITNEVEYEKWMEEVDTERKWLRDSRDVWALPEGGNKEKEKENEANVREQPQNPQVQESLSSSTNSQQSSTPPPLTSTSSESSLPQAQITPPTDNTQQPQPQSTTSSNNLQPPRQQQQPARRTSNRLAGNTPTHYVPLAGAPETALRVEFPTNKPSSNLSPLAYATLDNDLDLNNGGIIAATVSVDSNSTQIEVENAVVQALATSQKWTGNFDSPQYWEIRGRPDATLWMDAMAQELAAFEATGTWEKDLVDLPEGRRAIAVQWVLLIKRDTEGKIIKYKARLVARGDQQIDGIDFDETYSSTVRLPSVRLLFAILAANPHYSVRQFDISNAYLLGNLSQEIYIKQPQGFIDNKNPNKVRRLRKALYGLRQGGREWQKVLRTALQELGFTRCEADHGVYVRRRNGKCLFIPTHVDDGMVIGDDNIDKLLEELDGKLGGKLKEVETGLFLGMRVRRIDGKVELDQTHYIKNILNRWFPNGLSPVSTPLDSNASNLVAATEDERFDCPYRELLGALLYLSSCTRPDLTYALSFLGRFSNCPAKRHWTALQHVCRYLSGTQDLGLRYTTPSIPFSASLLTGWSDADHGADKDTRRSVSGFVFAIGDDGSRSTAISWSSKRQKSVAISSSEAEYMAMSEAGREAVWLRQLLRELGFPTPSATLIRGDNSGSLLLASHPTSHSRTKHIAIHYHYTRELVEEGLVELKWIKTDDMVADVFTKGLGRAKHMLFTGLTGLRNLRREGGCKDGAVDETKVEETG